MGHQTGDVALAVADSSDIADCAVGIAGVVVFSVRSGVAENHLAVLLEVSERGFIAIVISVGVRDALQLQTSLRGKLDSERFARVDYAEVVDAEAFEPVVRVSKPCFVLLAVFIGKTRLIDNLYIEPKSSGSEELVFHF